MPEEEEGPHGVADRHACLPAQRPIFGGQSPALVHESLSGVAVAAELDQEPQQLLPVVPEAGPGLLIEFREWLRFAA